MNKIDVKVFLDIDESVGYELNSLHKKITDFFIIPILNNIPRKLRKFIRKSHVSADEVIEHATTHKALEVLYHHGHPHKSESLFQKVAHYIWFHSNNSRGVRNRLRLVKRELRAYFLKLVEEHKDIEVLSIASGSARAVIESLAEARAVGQIKIGGIFLDKNPEAVSYSKELAHQALKDKHTLVWETDTVGNFFKSHNPENRFDVVEMVGLLDYFDNEKTVQTFHSIKKALKPGGILVTANIVDNSERKFVTNAIGWGMIYRSAEDLAFLLHEAGFAYENMKVFYEPLKVHTVIVASK